MHRAAALFLALILTMPLFPPLSARAVSVSAGAAILICADSGSVLWEKNAHARMGMASTTKIMTALYALTVCPDLTRVIEVAPEAAGIEGSSVYLEAGERLTLSQLLYAMMLQSANDAAAAIAIGLSGDLETFVQGMNDLAAELGLVSTHFENPHGLDGKAHYTTAYDLAVLTRHALKNEEFARIVSTKTYALSLQSGERMLVNHNRLLRQDERFFGVKTGYTMACGRCLVSAAGQEGVSLIAVTLRAPDDWNDHRALMEWGFAHTEHRVLVEAGELIRTLPVRGGEASSVLTRNIIGAQATLLKGEHRVQIRYELPGVLEAPVMCGQKCGEAVVLLDGEEYGRLSLFAANGVKKAPKPGPLSRIREALSRFFAWLFGQKS